MDIREEKGFTLLEMLLVIAIISIFCAAMVTLLITTTKLTSDVMKDNEKKSVATLLYPHIERSIREYEVKGAITVSDVPLVGSVLEIDTDPGNASSIKLYYFYESSEKAIYFQAENSFKPTDKEKSLKVVDNVEQFDVALLSAKKSLRLNVSVNQKSGVKEYANTIALKAY